RAYPFLPTRSRPDEAPICRSQSPRLLWIHLDFIPANLLNCLKSRFPRVELGNGLSLFRDLTSAGVSFLGEYDGLVAAKSFAHVNHAAPFRKSDVRIEERVGCQERDSLR